MIKAVIPFFELLLKYSERIVKYSEGSTLDEFVSNEMVYDLSDELYQYR